MPRSKADPTGQATNRRKGRTAIRARLTSAQRDVTALVRGLRYTVRREGVVVNATINAYDYQITPAELEQLTARVRDVIGGELLETNFGRMPPNWWWQSYAEAPYRKGTAEEVVAFNRLITEELRRIRKPLTLELQALELPNVLADPAYNEALRSVYVRDFQGMKALSDRTGDAVAQRIDAGIRAGKSPGDIAKDIAERFDVSRADAERTAFTAVNAAYNDSRMDANDLAAKRTGLRAGVLHLSALMLTTRDSHGGRHGNAYTTAQQREWWAEGANRIRCHCSTRSVLIAPDGRVVDTELQEEVRAERAFFDE